MYTCETWLHVYPVTGNKVPQRDTKKKKNNNNSL